MGGWVGSLAMVSRIRQWTIDVQDVDVMIAFWSRALGYRVDRGDDGAAKLYPPDDAPAETPTVWLQPSAGPKSGKNRTHPDLRADDVDAEVDRLIGLGARHADVGQGDEDRFVVLADPEGNEVCLLRNEPRAC